MIGRQSREGRFQKLAQRIEELHRKDETALRHRRNVMQRRNEGLVRLWRLCRDFADHLNGLIKVEGGCLHLTPADPPDGIGEDETFQLMLNVRGRILLLDLRPPASLVATDNFKTPYILEGEVRFFNQELLEEEMVEEHGLFFCHEANRDGAWYYWNGRTYKSGLVDEDYLASLLEKIL